jgi:phage-related protein
MWLVDIVSQHSGVKVKTAWLQLKIMWLVDIVSQHSGVKSKDWLAPNQDNVAG